MAIAPLQLPGPLVVPQLDWSGLDKIGDALMLRNERERQNKGFEDVVNSIGGAGGATPGQPGAPQPGAPMQAPTVPRGVRNNNFGNIKDGPFAKTQPGYKGADDEGHAIFETPEHGAQAMHALLETYGRKGMKTIRDVTSRWAPASDGNDPDAYARFVANGGDPDAPIDLADPATRAEVAKRMSMFEVGVKNFDAQGRPIPMQDRVAAGAPREGDISRVAQAAPVDVAAMEKVIPPAAKARMLALFKVGTKESQAAAYALLGKYVGKQEPIKLSEGDILVDPNDPSKVVGRAPGKSQTVREGGAIVQDGKVVYQAPQKALVDPGDKIEDQVARREAIAKSRGMDPNDDQTKKWVLQGQYDTRPGAGEKLEDQIATREAALKARGIDPTKDPRWQAYVMTGKLPGEDKMPLTQTDKKAIKEADDHVLAHDITLDNIAELKDLSKKAWGFKGSERASAMLAPFSQGAADTAQLNNAATANAVAQLKAIFGGNPTEGERAILLDIGGSSMLPDSERQKIYRRAERAVLMRRDLAEEQAAGIRDRSYWGPGGGKSGAATAPRTLSKEEVQDARSDPEKVRQEARDAIAGGRDRAGVLKRLQQLKISTEGL
jgi:hypothetical protein